MSGLTRRALGLGIAAALTLAGGTAMAAEVNWRMGSKMPVDSPEGQVFEYFARKVAEYSNGDFTVTVYPNEQLGKTDSVMEQLKLGTVQLYAEGSAYMRKWAPELNWTSAAFVFDDRDHWVRFMNSDLVKSWYAKAAEVGGVEILGDPTAILRGPYRVMVTRRDVRSLDDVKGLKLRMHPSKLAHATWTYLGAEVKTLAWTDVYQSISKGIVEAVNSPISLVEAMRFYEVAPHVVRHDEYYQSIGFMVNGKALRALSPAHREALMKAYADAGEYSFKVITDSVAPAIARMKAKGVTFFDIDRAPFVKRMESFYADMAKKGELPEGFLEAVSATRAAATN